MIPALVAHRFCLETKHLKERLELDFLHLGERLWKIRGERLYEPQWSDFGEFLMELKLSESTACRLIGIWHKFVFQFKIPISELVKAGGWTLLAEISPAIESKREAVHWLAKAQNLTVTDLRRELKEAKTGVEMKECKHEDSFILRCCKNCGLRERIYEQSEETVQNV